MELLLWPEGAPLAAGQESEDCPSITPYLLQDGQVRGAVIVCPGGGYGRRAPHEGEPVALKMNEYGFHAFVLKYRVAPYMHPAPLLDAQRAIRYVRSHAAEWNIDPQHIGILGFSAGGHLASTAGTHYDAGAAESADPIERVSCRPDFMVLCYAVISFGVNRHQGSMKNLIGAEPDPQLRDSLSNELQVTADTPPAFIWHTADDGGVPAENSLLFAQALGRQGIPYELHVFPHGRHGLGLGEEAELVRAWPELCGAWLNRTRS